MVKMRFIMHRRLPSIQLLPAFEAAARWGSMSRAAQELHVTASAVSQQIKQLEAMMGLPLFTRHTRRIELTEAGQAFYKVAARTMQSYRMGHADMFTRFGRPVLRISCMPTVAHQVILPGLASFQETFPGIDLRLDSRMDLVDFASESIDAAVRTGLGVWPGLLAMPLGPCAGTLVASPSLLARHPVRGLHDLRHHVLIHPRPPVDGRDDWDAVAEVLGVQRIDRKGDLILDSDLAGLQAAEQGLGIAIAFTPGANAWLKAGSLVALVPPVEMAQKHYFVFRDDEGDAAQRERLMAAYGWIKSRYEALQACLPAPSDHGLQVPAPMQAPA